MWNLNFAKIDKRTSRLVEWNMHLGLIQNTVKAEGEETALKGEV